MTTPPHRQSPHPQSPHPQSPHPQSPHPHAAHPSTQAQLPPPPPPNRPTAIGYDDAAFPPNLTPRETAILSLAIAGCNNIQISQRLHTPRHNVEKYILRLQAKAERHCKNSPLTQLLQKQH